jgi:hypothetical protein
MSRKRQDLNRRAGNDMTSLKFEAGIAESIPGGDFMFYQTIC